MTREYAKSMKLAVENTDPHCLDYPTDYSTNHPMDYSMEYPIWNTLLLLG